MAASFEVQQRILSLDEPLSRYGLERKDLERKCPARVRVKLAEHLGDWKMVGRYINIDPQKLDDIQVENHTEERRRVALLDAWDKREGEGATYLKLAEAFYRRKRIDLVEMLLREKITEIETQRPCVSEDPDKVSYKVQVKRRLDALQEEIIPLTSQLRSELEKNGITGDNLIDRLTLLPVEIKREYQESVNKQVGEYGDNCRSVRHVFRLLINPLTTILDYKLLEYLISRFGSAELKQQMAKYVETVNNFKREVTVVELKDHWKGVEDKSVNFTELRVRFGEDPTKCNLERLDNHRQRFCSHYKLSEFVMILLCFEPGSIIAVWQIPSVLVHLITESVFQTDDPFFDEEKILSISVAGKEIFPESRSLGMVDKDQTKVKTEVKEEAVTVTKDETTSDQPTGLTITQEGSEEREYCSQLFYLGQPNSCQVHFVVTWNIEAHLTAVQEEYVREGAIRGLRQPVVFESDTITLDIPMKGISISGWTITPLIHPLVTKKEVDKYLPSRRIPHVELEARPIGDSVARLMHKVDLLGAKPPRNKLMLSYMPTQVVQEGGGTVEERLRMKDEAIYSLKQEVASLKSENELLRRQVSLAPIKEEGAADVAHPHIEEKPLALVPVKTEVKKEAVTVTKTSAQPTAAWDLRGVEVCGEMTVVVHSSGAQQIIWKGFGLKLHIDEGSLPAGIHQCTLTIKASPAGQYEFPDNSYLVSAIFWLRCDPMCKFTKPVTVEMQHCANIANLKLKFVRAVYSQNQLPYTFEELGGDFTRHSSYGVVEVNGFSGLAITQEGTEEREYCSQLFYLGHPNSCQIHFVVTWNVEAHLRVVTDVYEKKGAVLGLHQRLDFESDTITLDIPIKGISISGWTITPLMRPVVTKKQVDNFKEGKLTPCCQLLAEVSARKKKVPILKHQVNLKGAKYPNNVVVISLPAENPYYRLKSQTFGDLTAAAVPNTQMRFQTFGDLVTELIPPPTKKSRLESDESAKQIPHLIATKSEHVSVDGPQLSLQHTSDPVPVTTISSHHLPSLLQQLYGHAASWRDIGGALGFTQSELDTIQASPSLHSSAPKSWLTKVLSDWLQWAPGDGRGSTHFATLEKLKDALKQASLGATAHALHL